MTAGGCCSSKAGLAASQLFTTAPACALCSATRHGLQRACGSKKSRVYATLASTVAMLVVTTCSRFHVLFPTVGKAALLLTLVVVGVESY